jgi:hypothetical protein
VLLVDAGGPLSGRCYECASAFRLSSVRGMHDEEITNNRWLFQAFGHAAVRPCVACGDATELYWTLRRHLLPLFVCLSVYVAAVSTT